jgi:hypothetical protein
MLTTPSLLVAKEANRILRTRKPGHRSYFEMEDLKRWALEVQEYNFEVHLNAWAGQAIHAHLYTYTYLYTYICYVCMYVCIYTYTHVYRTERGVTPIFSTPPHPPPFPLVLVGP